MSKKVKVIFPGGRTTYLDRKTAEKKAVVKMGGKIVEEVPPVVPKVYAKPIVEEAKAETTKEPKASKAKPEVDSEGFQLKTNPKKST